MWLLFLALFLEPLTSLYPSQGAAPLPFEVRADSNLLFGKGLRTAAQYYDVVVTRQPGSGVLVKLPYTDKGGRFSFDLHHRIALTPNFKFPSEVTTEVQVISGGANTLGTFAISTVVDAGALFDEQLDRVSKAEVDRVVTPMGRKTITLNTQPGPQSISIVGVSVVVRHAGTSTRVETPSSRIASVSNFKFEDAALVNPLTPPKR